MSDREKELTRFWSHVMKGPEPDDCWMWVGAISDDGYGRFSVRREGKQRTVRPQRYAYEQATGETLTPTTLLMHSCDVPLCVHATAKPHDTHLTPGTHRDNMIDRAQKHRTGNAWTALQWRGISRTLRVQRSRDLRSVLILHGWDRALISAALGGIELRHPTLF